MSQDRKLNTHAHIILKGRFKGIARATGSRKTTQNLNKNRPNFTGRILRNWYEKAEYEKTYTNMMITKNIRTSHNLKFNTVEDRAILPLPPTAFSQPKDEHRHQWCCTVTPPYWRDATIAVHQGSLQLASRQYGRVTVQHHWEAATWANHLQGQREPILTNW